MALKDQLPGTAENQEAFLAALVAEGSIYQACQLVGVSRMSVLRWRQADHAFDEACREAMEAATDRVESSLYRKAIEGDVRAQQTWLNARRRDLYNYGRVEHQHTGLPETVTVRWLREEELVSPPRPEIIEGEVRALPPGPDTPPGMASLPESAQS